MITYTHDRMYTYMCDYIYVYTQVLSFHSYVLMDTFHKFICMIYRFCLLINISNHPLCFYYVSIDTFILYSFISTRFLPIHMCLYTLTFSYIPSVYLKVFYCFSPCERIYEDSCLCAQRVYQYSYTAI